MAADKSQGFAFFRQYALLGWAVFVESPTAAQKSSRRSPSVTLVYRDLLADFDFGKAITAAPIPRR